MKNKADSFVRFFRQSGQRGTDRELSEFYNSIKDKSLIDQLIDRHANSPAPALQRNIASYKYSANANVTIKAIFDVSIELTIPVMTPVFRGYGGGFLVGYDVSTGTLYFDDPADLSGDSDWNANCASLYTNVNFIRNGTTYATFSGVGVPMFGLSGGTQGTWLT